MNAWIGGIYEIELCTGSIHLHSRKHFACKSPTLTDLETEQVMSPPGNKNGIEGALRQVHTIFQVAISLLATQIILPIANIPISNVSACFFAG